VIVSSSGAVDLQRALFRTGAVKTLIVTSPKGAELLAKNGVAALTSAEVRAIEDEEGKIAPASILKLFRDEFGVKILLHEGGPALFGDFVVHGCVDDRRAAFGVSIRSTNGEWSLTKFSPTASSRNWKVKQSPSSPTIVPRTLWFASTGNSKETSAG
jgi:riboflavin biosynthesis pyrimidine reductase